MKANFGQVDHSIGDCYFCIWELHRNTTLQFMQRETINVVFRCKLAVNIQDPGGSCRIRLSTLLIHSAYALVYHQTKSECYFLEDLKDWDLLPTPLVHDLVAINCMQGY